MVGSTLYSHFVRLTLYSTDNILLLVSRGEVLLNHTLETEKGC